MNKVVFENVRKKYGERVILDGISMSIESGQTAALIGPSGGGKSTILRCINGLNTFDSGKIQVGSYSLEANCNANPEVRKLFGMIFQDFQLFPHMTALQNIIEAPVNVLKQDKIIAKEKAMFLLNKVGLSSRADFYPKQLSGGQKQRVAIARALAMEPKGLLCDEITSALDPELKFEVLQTLEELKNDGLTIIMVTHEIHFARRTANRVLFLADGKIAEEGTPEEFFNNPQTARAKKFLGQVLA